jgi:hypothetical protein
MPSASAASVPIRGATCQSAPAAVRLRRGSITTSCVPRVRASSTLAQAWTAVVTRSALHEMITSDSAMDSGSAPPTGPHVASHATSAHVSQIVPGWSRVVPRAWKRAMGIQRLNCPWCAL